MYKNSTPGVQNTLLDNFKQWAAEQPFTITESLEDITSITYVCTMDLNTPPKVLRVDCTAPGAAGFIMQPPSLENHYPEPHAFPTNAPSWISPAPTLSSAIRVWISDEEYEAVCSAVKEFPQHTDFRLHSTGVANITSNKHGVSRFEKRTLKLLATRLGGVEQLRISCSFLDKGALKVVKEATRLARLAYFEDISPELIGLNHAWIEQGWLHKEQEFVTQVKFHFDSILNTAASMHRSID